MSEIPALPAHLKLEIVTPDRSVVAELIDELELPAADGYLGVLPGHTPMLTMLKIGELWYRKGSEKFYVAIAFGFAEILPDRITVLAELAERPDEIDVARAEAAKRKAEERISNPSSEMDFERARIALMKALIRIQVSSRARTRV